MTCKSLFLSSTSSACSTSEGSTAIIVGVFIAAAAFATDSVLPRVTTAFVDAAIAATAAAARWAAVGVAA